MFLLHLVGTWSDDPNDNWPGNKESKNFLAEWFLQSNNKIKMYILCSEYPKL